MSRVDRPGRVRALQGACANAKNGRRPRILRAIRLLVDQGAATRGGLGGRYRGQLR